MLDYNQAHHYVDTHDNAHWLGWDIVVFNPDFRAQSSKKGSFNRELGKWGYSRSYSPNRKGMWNLK